MIVIDGKEYTIDEVFGFINESVDNAVTYIDDYICGRTDAVSNDIFTDVCKIKGYTVNSHPCNPIRKSLRGRNGIYVFIVEIDKHLTYDEVKKFSHRCNGAGFPYWREIDLQRGNHFYQGSATSKSLCTRLNQHYSSSNEESSLRLNSSDRSIVKDNLSVYVFPIKKSFESESFFIRMIEKRLHIRFPALTGSSRV